MDKLSYTRESLRKFGITMAAAFTVISLLIFLKHRHSAFPTGIISLVFLIFALALPQGLKPVYIFWMRLAVILSWINTRLILTVMFYLIFTPIGLCMRIFAADLLDKKISKGKDSYWIKKEAGEFDPKTYERQF